MHMPEFPGSIVPHKFLRTIEINGIIAETIHEVPDRESSGHRYKMGDYIRIAKCKIGSMIGTKATTCNSYTMYLMSFLDKWDIFPDKKLNVVLITPYSFLRRNIIVVEVLFVQCFQIKQLYFPAVGEMIYRSVKMEI
ncbi:hypothetical protein BGV45_25950 [Serratia marcescens]|nr:hypothetical protein BGV45_25950 [Serratia marcescens]